MPRVSTCLWFDGTAEEAARFYTSIVRDSEVTAVHVAPAGLPYNEEGSVLLVEFTLGGQEFQALNGGAQFPFTEAASIVLNCETQQEADEYWDALTADGEEGVCGWCKDRYGLSWQIAPEAATAATLNPDPEAARRAFEQMMTMTRLDGDVLARAARGE